jgi:hypothetical protein
MLAGGITIFLAFWLLWSKLQLETRLKALSHHFALDAIVSITVWLMFGGTGEGMLAATFAAVIMSINITLARKLFGYLEETEDGWQYHSGMFDQSHKFTDETKRLLDSGE